MKGVRNCKSLGLLLHVPGAKLAEIKRKHASEEERKSAILDYWLLTDPAPSWRTLIVALDGILDCLDSQVCSAADRIREQLLQQ